MNKVKLGELLKVKHGYAFKSENYVEKSQYALVTLANISESNNFQFNSLKTTYYGTDFPSEFELKEDDLIMPLTEQVVGLFGNSAFIPHIDNIQFVLNQRVGKVIPFEDKADKYYLHYLLSTETVRKQLEYRSSGTRQRNISPNDVYDVTVFVPELQTQRKIGKLLYDLERKINNNNAINDNLEQQAKLLYDYWFNQFDFPDESGKPYRSSGGKMVWNEQLKMEIPFSWVCSKMENAIEAVRTGLNPRNNFKLGNGNIQYITVKNLCLNGSLDFFGCDTIDEQARQIIHRRSDIQIDDILFASIAPLGRCYLIQENPTNWDINESVFSIRYNSSVLTAEYLYMNLQSEAFVKRATACSTGSIFKGIRINSLMDSEIILPPLSVTKEFSKEIKPLFALQKELDRETHTLIQLRDWLLPVLMNGQATISD